MSISPPTDRLQKFLVIGGLVLTAAGTTYPLQQYHEAELQPIDTLEKLQQSANSLGPFGERVDNQIFLLNEVAKSDFPQEQMRSFSKQFSEN